MDVRGDQILDRGNVKRLATIFLHMLLEECDSIGCRGLVFLPCEMTVCLTDWLLLFASGCSKLFKSLVSYTRLVESHRVPGLLMERIDLPTPLLGDLLLGLLQRGRHFEVWHGG